MKKLNVKEHFEYLKDESQFTGTADAIFLCDSIKDIEEAFEYAKVHNKQITLQGALTGLCGGAVPEGGVVVNISELNKVLGMTYDDGYCLHVEAGISLGEINSLLQTKQFDIKTWSEESKNIYMDFQKEELFFACDPTETLATIGGMVACEASGAISYKYGSVREHINGVKILTPKGIVDIKRGMYTYEDLLKILKVEDLPSLKVTVDNLKNAAGIYYKEDMDLVDLFIGSEGVFGIIVEVTLKLTKKPKQIVGMQLFFKDDQTHKFVQFLREEFSFRSSVAAIEYFDSKALELLYSSEFAIDKIKQFEAIPDSVKASLYIEFHLEEDSLDQLLIELVSTFSKYSIIKELQWISLDDTDYQKLKTFRHLVPEVVNHVVQEQKRNNSDLTKIGTDMAVLDKDLEYIMNMYKNDLEAARLDYIIFGHIGDNHLHVNILPKSVDEMKEGWSLVTKWAKVVIKLEGTVSAEHGIGKLKKGLFDIMFSNSDIINTRKLKKLFDSEYRINRGVLID